MLKFVELQLGQGWAADPNAPEPRVSIQNSSVSVCFRTYRPARDNVARPSRVRRALPLFSSADPKFDETWSTLNFIGCSRWRWDDTNDHEWYKEYAHGRYSGMAPLWGKFYELVGDDPMRDAVP